MVIIPIYRIVLDHRIVSVHTGMFRTIIIITIIIPIIILIVIII